MSRSRRARLHDRLAESFEDAGDRATADRHRLAAYWANATGSRSLIAIDAGSRAARDAMHLGASAEAAKLARNVLEVWRSCTSEDRELRRDVALDMHLVIGHSIPHRRYRDAAAAYEAGYALARTDDERAKFLVALGWLLYQHGEFVLASSAYDRGLALQGAGPAARLHLITDKAWLIARQGLHGEALALLDQAGEESQVQDPEVVGRFLDRKASILGHMGRPADGLRLITRAYEQAVASRSDALIIGVLLHHGRLLLQAGQPFRALAPLAEGLSVARSVPDLYAQSVVQWVRTDVLLVLGDLDGALAANRDEERLLTLLDNPRHLAECMERGRRLRIMASSWRRLRTDRR